MKTRITSNAWVLLVLGACAAAACAKGSNDSGGAGGSGGASSSSSSSSATSASSSSSTSSSTSTASSGAGGAGGGEVTSSSSSTGSSTSSSSSASSSSGAMQGTVLLIAYGSTVIGATTDLVKKTGFANPYQDTTNDAPGVAFTGSGLGYLVAHSTTGDELHYAIWNQGWNPGFGQKLLAVQPGVAIVGAPAIAGGSATVHVVYQAATDMAFYYALGSNGSWLPKQEAIAGTSGPVPPTVGVLADEPIALFVGADGDLHDVTRANGAWGSVHALGVPGTVASVTPAIAALESGPELVVVYNTSAGGLRFATRSGGTWSAAQDIAGATSNDPVSIAPIPGGGAVLAWKGVDAHLYTALLASGANPSFSAPVVGAGGANPTLQVAPNLARGAMGADAELVYLDTSFTFSQARLNAGTWSAPAFGGAAGGRVAIATGH